MCNLISYHILLECISLLQGHLVVHILQRFSGGELLTAFLEKIAILKYFFFILLLRFFVGTLADWRQAICRHYCSASTFLHWLIQFMIFFIQPVFLRYVIIYILLLIYLDRRVVLNSVSWFFCWKSTGSVFTAYAHAPWVMKNMSYSCYTHAHFVQAHICICRKKI